jgi:uncharacterized protein (TIGR02246 family)
VCALFDGLLEDWSAAVRAKDPARLAAMLTEDCVFLAPHAPPMRGRKTVEQLYANLFMRYDLVQEFHFEETQRMGVWAFGWGTDDVTMTPVGGGQVLRFAGHGVSILRREPSGVWQFARGINNATRQESCIER